MRLSDFDFHLPTERIALYPAKPRDTARMLVVRPGQTPELSGHLIRDLPAFLRAGDALVFNDTKVIPARLFGRRERAGISAKIEILLHQRLSPSHWLAFAKPGKKLSAGDRLHFGDAGGNVCLLSHLSATLEEKRADGQVVVAFDLSGPALDEAIMARGEMPLPPYIASARPSDAADHTDYQTIYAREEGAVAAPTAGLHFTEDLFARLDAAGVSRHFVTLHVGAGTFLPMKDETLAGDRLHTEIGTVSSQTATELNEVRHRGGRIVPVGTTSLRLLESAADANGMLHPFAGTTDIFIKPGYRFRAADLMLTNFHLPKSTLLVLVAAFSGLKTMQQAYAHAIEREYRFYSYGDACLLAPVDSTHMVASLT